MRFLQLSKPRIFRKRDEILRDWERLSSSFRNYNLLRSKLDTQSRLFSRRCGTLRIN